MTEKDPNILRLARMVLFGMVIQLLVIAYVFYVSYEGQERLVKAQQAACLRGKTDRRVNAQGWRIAEAARREDGQADVANKYAEIAAGLEERARVVCEDVFPDAKLIP